MRRYFNQSGSKAVVLMYHRICNLKTDPWQLAVSPENFRSQIKMLKKNFNVLPLWRLEEQFNIGKLKHKSVYITFDDAYTDNYIYAKPILEKYKCPATFFVPSYFIGKGQLFWWDALERIFLHSPWLPNQLRLMIDNKSNNFYLETENLTKEVKEKQEAWRWFNPSPTKRCELYLKIWELLKPISHNKIVDVIDALQKWAGYSPVLTAEDYAMTDVQLKDLASNTLFKYGIHTHTHPALSSCSAEKQSQEIAVNKKFLIEQSYPVINAIAYPYGNYNDVTIKVASQNGMKMGFSTKREVVNLNSMPLSLGRVQVNNTHGLVLKKELMQLLNSE
ncbi:polysaccharide deacetylase family protein [Autumnicola psychrophila]|uniref:Polysaccharide deacetylase family protein n=1 Tax=Autumnicola psychrophila TaxID=3075592 RepID=A0ABU3DWK4_9FLAO|nr:polysaccharide deacetylase family protein [Zunongwangia sp. F225]MDT0688118.1 polysaccharide deacetylase family protein [Zunongwangia sp. F225]